jgi:hypothetical protein
MRFCRNFKKELGLSIGPKDPLLALWVSQRELLEQNAATTAKIAERVSSCTWQESNRLVRAGEGARTTEFKHRPTGSSK